MTFTLIDVILLLIFFGFICGGFAMGLIRSIGALVGLGLGAWLAGHYFMPVADRLAPFIGGNDSIARIISFLLIFIIINRLAVLVFHLIDKAFNILSVIPFLKSLNRIGGVILGAIEGFLTLGLIIYVIAKFAPDWSFVRNDLNNSQVAHYLVALAKWLIALLPQAFGNIKSVF